MWIFQAFRALLVEYQLTNHHILAVQMPNNESSRSWGEGANYTPLPPLMQPCQIIVIINTLIWCCYAMLCL